jgi:quercetin dioxygenase-like cupin family protein
MAPSISPIIHTKGWGHEIWIVNNEFYCGKILHFKKGKRCSFHYHKIKTETFYLQYGRLVVSYSEQDDIDSAKEVILLPGDTFHVPIGLRHQMIALEESELFEFSTQHFESDSYRIVKGD